MSDPFRALFMASPVATAIATDSDGRILLANPAWLELLGWEGDAVIGRTVEDVGLWVRPERRALIIEKLRSLGSIRDLAEEVRTKSGEILTVLISICVVEFEGERCLVGAFNDITEFRRQEGLLREGEEHFRQVTESAQQGFLLRELDPPVTLYASPGVERIYGITRAACYEDATVLDTAIHPDDQSQVLAKPGAMTGPEDHEFRIVRPDGETRWVRARAAPVRTGDDGFIRIASVIDDVTEERALNAALSASEERVRMLVRSVTDYAIIGLDAEGRVADWNPGAERIKGYHANEIIGRHFSVFYPPEQVEAGHPQRELEAAVAAGRYQEEGERVRQDGSRFWADVTLMPIYDDAGELRGFAKVTRDITERRAAEHALRESEARFRVLAENSTDVITRASPDATLLYVSPASRAVYGYEPAELVGRSARADIHPEDHAALLADLDAGADGPDNLTREYRFRRKDGSYVWVETKTRVLRDPGTQAVIEYQSSTSDISERKCAEAAARGAQEQSERANRAKNEFLSRMSHELRTPLHAILGFGELLGREDLSAGQHEKLGLLTRSGRYLLELINEVLDVSRIERGELRLSLEPVHLGEVVRETLEMVLPLAAARSITVQEPGAEDLDIHVLADRHRLKQVLLNLLSNAVKYNREGGNVTVRATSAGPTARIEVLDTGIGIARDALPRVFEPFDRLGAEATEVDGAGLGLTLSKRLMEAMDGEIGIDSRLGTGTTAWIKLPVVAAPVVALRPPQREPTIPAGVIPNRPMTALYVEDNPSNIKLVETMLAARPEVTLLVATQGSLGIELAREHRPDLILLDLNLPDISGEEVLRRLRSDARTAKMPVVITSADATASQIKRLRNAGARDYLTKPFGVEQLFAAIDAVSEAEGSSTAPAVLDHRAIAALHELAGKHNVGASAVRQLIRTYLADALVRCAGIEQAIGAGDLAEVKRQAHALGGASGWAGATDVLHRCRELETGVERDDAEGIASVSAGLAPALAMARVALEAEFDSPPGVAGLAT